MNNFSTYTYPSYLYFSYTIPDYNIKYDYEDNLKRRQKEHLDQVNRNKNYNSYSYCLHDSCSECIGTGVKIDGSFCIHYISCACPKCSPFYFY